MAKNEMAAGAGHVLAHGTARTRAAAAKTDGGSKEAGDKDKGKADGKKRIKRMVIEPADDKSMVIRHEHHPPDGEMMPTHKDETYTTPNIEGLKQHIEEHLGGGEVEPAKEEAAEEQMAEHAQGGEGGAAGASAG